MQDLVCSCPRLALTYYRVRASLPPLCRVAPQSHLACVPGRLCLWLALYLPALFAWALPVRSAARAAAPARRGHCSSSGSRCSARAGLAGRCSILLGAPHGSVLCDPLHENQEHIFNSSLYCCHCTAVNTHRFVPMLKHKQNLSQGGSCRERTVLLRHRAPADLV